MSIIMKRCRICDKLKPLKEGFHKKWDNRDGRASSCRTCLNARRTKNFQKQNGRDADRPTMWRDGITTENNINRSIGGKWMIHKDIDNSFSEFSSFKYEELRRMVQNGYIAIGTEFRNKNSGKVLCVSISRNFNVDSVLKEIV